MFLTLFRQGEASSLLSERQKETQLLTNNGDAALSSYFYHFVHQGFGSSGKLVPLKDTNWTIPHDLLGPPHNFNKLLHTFRAAVQALRQGREATDTLPVDARLTAPQPSWDPQKLPSRPPDTKCVSLNTEKQKDLPAASAVGWSLLWYWPY